MGLSWCPGEEHRGRGGREDNGRGFASFQIYFLLDLAVPAPPANLSLGLATQPPALTASWSPPPGGRDGFQLRLYRLRPLTLESKEALTPETQNFSWTPLPPGTAFLVQLATSRGPDESSSTNATGWMRECPLHTPSFLATLAGWIPQRGEGGCVLPLTSSSSVHRQLG